MSEPVQASALDPASRLVDASGRAARRQAATDRCPGCGAGPEKRVASGGFGRLPHPICPCGHEWPDEVFRG